jgi:hypothetical protein
MLQPVGKPIPASVVPLSYALRWSKRRTRFQSIFLHKTSIQVLDLLAHVDQLDAGLNEALRIFANLSMYLRGMPNFVIKVRLNAFLCSQLLAVRARLSSLTKITMMKRTW